MDNNEIESEYDKITLDNKQHAAIALQQKLIDMGVPGFQVEFDPEEAESAGAFIEDALSEQDATDGIIDLFAEITSTEAVNTHMKD